MKRILVGVVGGGDSATEEEKDAARALGRLIAMNGWVVLNGGRRSGCMHASAEGAQKAGGLTIGLLPDNHGDHASEYLDIQIITGLNNARNNVITLSSDVVIACSGGAGTLSEIALALKNNKNVILMGFDLESAFHQCGPGSLFVAKDPADAIEKARHLLNATPMDARSAQKPNRDPAASKGSKTG